jgi:ABC-2 type transport system ATP-binding protein
MPAGDGIRMVAGMIPILEVQQLSKRYGDLVAVDGVDFSVDEGEIFGILGLNGAGKTTMVECVQGLRRPDAGSVRLLGRDPRRERSALASRVGSQLQDSNLPERMRVSEAVKLFADRRVSRAEVAEWGLDALWGKSFGALSGGQRQRLFIALALVNEPEIVFLDELTQGLDPAARRIVWDLVRRIRDRGTTVVLVTHFTDEAEILCDRVVVVRDGAFVAHGSPAELVEEHGPGVGVSFTDPRAEAGELRSICGVRSVGLSGDRVELRGDRRMLAHVGAHLVDTSRARGTPVPSDLRVDEPSLEDAVLELIGPGITTTSSAA